MSHDALFIDRIVREVLRRLGDGAQRNGGADTVPSAPQHVSGEPGTARATGNLRLTGKVVSLADIEGKLSGIGQVLIPDRAVVTPAVKDLLRQRRIELQRSGRSLHRPAATTAQSVPLVLASVTLHEIAGGLTRQLATGGQPIEQLPPGGLLTVTRALCASVQEGSKLGVLVTDQVAPALCLLNRRAEVRAAAADSVAEVRAARDSLGLNVLVIDPQGKSLFAQKQIALEFCRGGLVPCPAVLQEALEADGSK